MRLAVPKGPSRSVLAGCAAVVVLSVIAAAAGATHHRAGGNDGADPRWLLDAVMSILAMVVAIGGIATLFGWLGWLEPAKEVKEKDLWERVATVTVLIVVVAVLLLILFTGRKAHPTEPPVIAIVRQGEGQKPVAPAAPVPPIDWWVVGGAGLLMLGAIGMLMSWARIRGLLGLQKVAGPVEPEAAAAAVGAVDESVEALLSEPDPRRAVIAAYVRMEGLLGRMGVARRPWEAPFEYLERVLVSFGATASTAGRLTELFERARFSDHVIGADMRQNALDSLRDLRAELAGVAAGVT